MPKLGKLDITGTYDVEQSEGNVEGISADLKLSFPANILPNPLLYGKKLTLSKTEDGKGWKESWCREPKYMAFHYSSLGLFYFTKLIRKCLPFFSLIAVLFKWIAEMMSQMVAKAAEELDKIPRPVNNLEMEYSLNTSTSVIGKLFFLFYK